MLWNVLQCAYFFGSKMNNCNTYKKNLPTYRFAEWIEYANLFPLHNEFSPMPVGWKLWEAQALKWPETWLFRRAVYINMYYRKMYNYTTKTNYDSIECIQVWMLLGYPSNILGYPINSGNYTSKRKLWWFPTSPRPPPVGNFLIFIWQKILFNIKNVEFDFSMGCILDLFLFLWIRNLKFKNFWSFNFWFFNDQN